MNKFLFFIIIIYLLLSPIYLFPSGMPQIADFVVGLGCLFFVFTDTFRTTLKKKIIRRLFLFVILVTIINVSYSFYFYAIKGIKNTMYFVPLFYIFNFLFFILFIQVLKYGKTNFIKKVNSISLVIIITLSIQFILAIIGFQYGTIEEGYRATIFFNNPNQLGYFTLLSLSIFTVLPSKYRGNKIFIIYTFSLGAYLVLYSGSRAALAGVFLLGIILFYLEGFKLKMSSILLIIFIIISIPYILQTEFFISNFELITIRNERILNTNVTEAQIRGYDRFILHPEYMFYGAGEGYFDRFRSYHNLEMHSGFGTILFSYGILGFVLFLRFFQEVIRKKTVFYLFLLSPVLIYNLTHQGLRTTLFWALLASIFLISNSKNIKINKDKKNG